MSTRRQTGLYRRITDLETLVERLEARLRDSIKQKHEPVAYLGRTATEIPQKSSGTLGEGEIFIYEVDKNKDEFDTAQRFKAVNFSSAGSIAEDKDVIALRVGRTQEFVIPRFPEANCLIAKVTSAISARTGTTPGSGVVDVVIATSGSFVTDSPTTLTVYNSYDSSIAIDQYIIIVEDAKEQKWWSVPKGSGTSSSPSLRVRGNLKSVTSGGGGASFAGATGAGPFTLENIEGIDAAWAGAAEITVTNPEGHKLWTDGTCHVRAEYNDTSGDWEVYSAQADRIVHSVRIFPGECKFGMLNALDGWRYWHDNAAGTVMDANWVKHVHFLGTELFYDKCSESDILVKTFQYVEVITWDAATRTLGFDYNDLTSDTLTFPNFVTDFSFNTTTCKFDVSRWTGLPVERAFPDFVTDVDLSSGDSVLTIDYCLAADKNIDMPYLVNVSVVGSFIVREYADGTTANVIELTSCPP